jgi:hypothetical protein
LTGNFIEKVTLNFTTFQEIEKKFWRIRENTGNFGKFTKKNNSNKKKAASRET